MQIIDVIGWAGTVGVLAAYATHRRRLFDWANALLFAPVAAPALVRGAYSSAAVSVAFGVIGIAALTKGRR